MEQCLSHGRTVKWLAAMWRARAMIAVGALSQVDH
jgi:hypothetical protein